jgi:hypothetical protein
MDEDKYIIKQYSSSNEKKTRKEIVKLFRECPIPENEILSNLGLFIKRQDLSRILFFNELYQKILHTHGVIIEFGVRWGQSLALFESLRGMYEPFNHNRKIIGFDTFDGFPSTYKKDGQSEIVKKGAYSVSKNYERYLEDILDYHEQESPISHIKKYKLVKGDAISEIDKFFEDNPETIVAFAYFDFDIYEPTKKCLEAIKPHITKGTVIGFDELNIHDFPGETLALKEVFGLDKFKIHRTPYSSVQSYIVFD